MKGLVLTYVLAAIGTVGSFWNPLVGMFVYSLFSVVRPQQMFGWAGNLSNMSLIVGLAMLAGWALHGFGSWNFGRARWCARLLISFFLWNCLSAAFAPNANVAWATVLERLKVVLPVLVGLTMFSSLEQVRAYAWALVLGQGYVAAEMNWSYAIDHVNRVNAEGYFGDNNAFGISLVATIGPALFLAFDARRPWAKALALGCAALIMHTVLLTFSRGAIVSLIATGIVVAVLMPKKPTYLLSLVVVAALGVRLMGPEVTARFMTSFAESDERDVSAQSRLDLWRDALTVIASRPLLGVGPRHWPFIAEEFGWNAGKEVHSTWLQGAAEIGIPGMASLLGFYLVAAWSGLRLAYSLRGSPAAVLGLYTFSGLIGFICAAQFVTYEGSELPYYIALVGAGTLKLLPGADRTETAMPQRVSPPSTGALPAA